MLSTILTMFARDPAALSLDGREPPTARPGLPAAREALRTAHAARAEAEAALRYAEAHTERVRQLGVDADDAEHTADQAAKLAADATRRWAVAGARGDMPADDAALVDAAMAAKRRAEQRNRPGNTPQPCVVARST